MPDNLLIRALESSHSNNGHVQEKLNNDLILDANQPQNEQQATWTPFRRGICHELDM